LRFALFNFVLFDFSLFLPNLISKQLLLIAGPFSCAECPVFDSRVVKWPVLERRSLSLKKQKELRRWMIDEAIQSAEHLIASSATSMIESGDQDGKKRSNFEWNPMTNFAWSSPSDDQFSGSSSNSDHNEL